MRQNLTEKQYNYLIFRKILGWLGYQHLIGAQAHFDQNDQSEMLIFALSTKKKERNVTKKLTKNGPAPQTTSYDERSDF